MQGGAGHRTAENRDGERHSTVERRVMGAHRSTFVIAAVLGWGCGEERSFPLLGFDDPSRPPGRLFSVSPSDLSMPTVLLECGASEGSFVIRNFDNQPLRVFDVDEVDGNDAFRIDWPGPLPSRALEIGPRRSARVVVRFLPPGLGTFRGRVSFRLSADGSARQTVEFVGRSVESASAADSFQQINSLNVDVVFVVDNSASMRLEQVGLRDNFQSFVRAADDGFTDYRVAVTTTDIERESGRFVPVSQGFDVNDDGVPDDLDLDGDVDDIDLIIERQETPMRRVERTTEPTPEFRFRRLVDVGVGGAETEQGLEAALLALSPSRTLAANAFFFREDALLSLIFVSDERDQSPREVEDYVSAFRTLAPSGRVRASAVVGPELAGCTGPGGDATAGPRYAEVARRLGGTVASICTEDWATTMERISGIAFGLQRSFVLSGFARGLPTVFIDDRERPPVFESGTVSWTYDVGTRTVEFSVEQTPPLGSEVRIEYELGCAP